SAVTTTGKSVMSPTESVGRLKDHQMCQVGAAPGFTIQIPTNTGGMIIAVIATGALLMATEFPDDPEVDLGFRDPATENSIRESAEEWKPQMELRLDYEPPISKERLSNPWWSLRITIIF